MKISLPLSVLFADEDDVTLQNKKSLIFFILSLYKCRLSWCDMTDEGCSDVTSALKSNPSHLRELELSGNKLGDSGVKNLSDLLMNPQFKLEKLQLVSLYCTARHH